LKLSDRQELWSELPRVRSCASSSNAMMSPSRWRPRADDADLDIVCDAISPGHRNIVAQHPIKSAISVVGRFQFSDEKP